MAYITKTNIKSYLGIDGSQDDTLLATLAGQAQAMFETACRGRKFESSSTTKYYDVPQGRTLYLGMKDDLLTVTTLTNGDDSEITSSDYQLLPLNDIPKYAIRLKEGSNILWEDDSDGNREGVISVAGTWGWMATPTADIIYAVTRMGALLYRNKDAQVFDVIAMPDQGTIIVPKGTPADIIDTIKFYRRPTL